MSIFSSFTKFVKEAFSNSSIQAYGEGLIGHTISRSGTPIDKTKEAFANDERDDNTSTATKPSFNSKKVTKWKTTPEEGSLTVKPYTTKSSKGG